MDVTRREQIKGVLAFAGEGSPKRIGNLIQKDGKIKAQLDGKQWSRACFITANLRWLQTCSTLKRWTGDAASKGE